MAARLGIGNLSLLHPFHVATDRHLVIISLGASLQKVCPSIRIGLEAERCISFVRPQLRFDIGELRGKQRTLLLLESNEEKVAMRGQLVVDDAQGVVFFALTPRVLEYNDHEAMRLSVHDFAPSDPILDMLLLHRAIRLRQAELEAARANLLAEMEERRRVEEALRDANAALSDKLTVILEQSQQITVMQDDISALEQMERMKSEFI